MTIAWLIDMYCLIFMHLRFDCFDFAYFAWFTDVLDCHMYQQRGGLYYPFNAEDLLTVSFSAVFWSVRTWYQYKPSLP